MKVWLLLNNTHMVEQPPTNSNLPLFFDMVQNKGWLNRDSPSRFPAHIATKNEDLAADLKQTLAQAKWRGRRTRKTA